MDHMEVESLKHRFTKKALRPIIVSRSKRISFAKKAPRAIFPFKLPDFMELALPGTLDLYYYMLDFYLFVSQSVHCLQYWYFFSINYDKTLFLLQHCWTCFRAGVSSWSRIRPAIRTQSWRYRSGICWCVCHTKSTSEEGSRASEWRMFDRNKM